MNKLERWVKASYATAPFDQAMVIVVQGLGRLDVTLTQEDHAFLADFAKNRNSITETLKLNERYTLSYLWVLGGYELIRTICQRIAAKQVAVTEDVQDGFQAVKKVFCRLRIPLAKMEPATSHKTDHHIAFPAVDQQKGVAWRVAPDVFITRQDLADRLLAVLELARSKDPHFAARS